MIVRCVAAQHASVLSLRDNAIEMGDKGRHIACLHEYRARARESTRKTLAGTPVGDDTSGSNSFNLVFAVPGY